MRDLSADGGVALFSLGAPARRQRAREPSRARQYGSEGWRIPREADDECKKNFISFDPLSEP